MSKLAGATRFRRLFSYGAVLVLAAATLGATITQDTQENSAVLQAEEHWARALVTHDTVALAALYAEDIVYVHSDGDRETKAEYIRRIDAGRLKYESVNLVEPKVRVYGDAAVVNGLFDVRVISDGTPVNTRVVYLHVYVRQGNAWRMVAHQTTRARAAQ
jgi:uncharacterized protein (TIGR02246 family)